MTRQRLASLLRDDRKRIETTGRRSGSVLRVHDAFNARPLASVQALCSRTGLSFPAANSAVDLLVEMGIVRELTGKRWNRVFAYDRYLAILDEGTE